MASSTTKVVRVRDIYEEVVAMQYRMLVTALKISKCDFYAWDHPGPAWPQDIQLWRGLIKYGLGADFPIWCQWIGGGPFERVEWRGMFHIGPNCESRALGQDKPRLSGLFSKRLGSDLYVNKMRIRVPHE